MRRGFFSRRKSDGSAPSPGSQSRRSEDQPQQSTTEISSQASTDAVGGQGQESLSGGHQSSGAFPPSSQPSLPSSSSPSHSGLQSSSASVLSRPSTVSTAQSSVFSRAAPSSRRTMSSYGSTGSSGHRKFEGIQEASEEGSSGGMPMRVVDVEEMSTYTDDSSNTPGSRGRSNNGVSSSRVHVQPHSYSLLLPDVPSSQPVEQLASLLTGSSAARSSQGFSGSNGVGAVGASSSNSSGSQIGGATSQGRRHSMRAIIKDLAEDLVRILEQYVNGRLELSRAAQGINQTLRTAATAIEGYQGQISNAASTSATTTAALSPTTSSSPSSVSIGVSSTDAANNAYGSLLPSSMSSSFLPSISHSSEPSSIVSCTDPSIQQVLKCVLHMTDNLLRNPAQQHLKMYILRALTQLGTSLGLLPRSPTGLTVQYPKNFAIGTSGEAFGAQATMDRIMNAVIESNGETLAEQDGAFVAPLLRGLAPSFAILTLSFGFPRPEQSHFDKVASLYPVLDHVHAYCQKNYISVCSSSSQASGPTNVQPLPSFSSRPASSSPSVFGSTGGGAFAPPYRVPNPNSPPMSISIATESATVLSGTLGGYIYPRINASTNPALAAYADSSFAITCAHVCLSENNASSAYPFVSSPSPVLVGMYKNALRSERDRYSALSLEYREYDNAVRQLDEAYPANKPKKSLGQVVWGERAVLEGSMSDLAIIRVNPGTECRNFLGDDVPFSAYDPGLMFGNLSVKRIVKKLAPGMKVFKYGSTSKYTSGNVNGPRLVYWADGELQSSEFVVCSDVAGFASGGDSGAWILHKGSEESGQQYGLGVVGMLHSYDGERKELGLFTPISLILNRLHQVTQIPWGIIGVPDEDDMVGGSDTDSTDDTDNY